MTCFFMILSLLNVNKFNSFQFVDYEDCRRVVIDGNEYNFDNEFHHNDSNATQILCTIDCLIADLEEDNIEAILKKIEKRLIYICRNVARVRQDCRRCLCYHIR